MSHSRKPGDDVEYIFTMPSILWSGQSETVCLAAYGNQEKSVVDVSVRYEGENLNTTFTLRQISAGNLNTIHARDELI